MASTGRKYSDSKEVVVWGTGFDAVVCTYSVENEGKKIKYFLNTDCNMADFMGYAVYNPTEQKLKDVFILVASSEETYHVISAQMKQYGLEEFRDYIYYKLFNKKVVLLHGNCHMLIINNMLCSSKKFNETYSVYPNPQIQNLDKKGIDTAVLKNVDVWIHEDIRDDNEFGYFVSDSYIKSVINKEAKDITIPNLFGMGYMLFPKTKVGNPRNGRMKNNQDQNGMFPHMDNVIDRCKEESMDVEEIIQYCMRDDAISAGDILDNFNLYIGKIKEREKKWDIQISQYILQNYQKEKMFYDSGHPTNILLKKIAQEILRMLNIEDNNIFSEISLGAYEIPVYPCVRKCLGVAYNTDLIRESRYARKAKEEMSFSEYIREYVRWCYGNR